MGKLYLVTRQDLSPAQQAVQSCHAALQFALEWPVAAKDWALDSNTIVLLTMEDEKELLGLSQKALKKGVAHSAFTEPDRNDELTAVAIAPEGRRICHNLKLLGV